jgi:hypothetical protein
VHRICFNRKNFTIYSCICLIIFFVKILQTVFGAILFAYVAVLVFVKLIFKCDMLVKRHISHNITFFQFLNLIFIAVPIACDFRIIYNILKKMFSKNTKKYLTLGFLAHVFYKLFYAFILGAPL